MIKRFQFLEMFMIGLFISSLFFMLFPVSSLALDIGLMMSLTFSLFVLIVTVKSENFSHFSVFPVLLLLTTFFRLCLNVASTRKILTEGHYGTEAVGSIISFFGYLVSDNNIVIGFVIFLTLVLVNFIVISNGSQRVAEVVARFTLDALPGKQMSIESELKAGHLTEEQAQKKRENLERESDFYGAMDGASKFLRGDAIASLCIMALNLVGGIVIGVFQKGLSFSESSNHYTMLTIGDGLANQIPAVLISISAGILITGSRRSQTLLKTLSKELFQSKTIYSVAFILMFIGLLPGVPVFLFMTTSVSLFLIAYLSSFKKESEVSEIRKPPFLLRSIKQLEKKSSSTFLQSEKQDHLLISTSPLEIQMSYDWTPCLSSFLHELSRVRKELCRSMGYKIPFIQIRDNLDLKTGEVRLFIKGKVIYEERIPVRRLLVLIEDERHLEFFCGFESSEPIWGLPSYWISKDDEKKASLQGCRVFQPEQVLSYRIKHVLQTHAALLFTRLEAKKWFERIKIDQPYMCSELIPEKISMTQLFYILKTLLEEEGSIREAFMIFEIISEEIEFSSNQEELLKNVKERIKRSSQKLKQDEDSKI